MSLYSFSTEHIMTNPIVPEYLYHLIPNGLTLVFSVTCLISVTLGTALFRRHKVKLKTKFYLYYYRVWYAIVNACNFAINWMCSIWNCATKFRDLLRSFRCLEASPNCSLNVTVSITIIYHDTCALLFNISTHFYNSHIQKYFLTLLTCTTNGPMKSP